jgi:hypothetical protein
VLPGESPFIGAACPAKRRRFLRQGETLMPENDADLSGATRPSRRSPLLAWVLTGLGVVGCGILLGIVLYTPASNGTASDPEPQNLGGPKQGLFASWTKPDVALVISGEMHGYLQPCGCSDPQYGGLVRRYNFIEQLKSKQWPVVAVDLGDIATEKPSGRQSVWKYATAMEALKIMHYTAIGIGKNEFQSPLIDLLAEYSLQKGNETPKVLAANLEDGGKPDGPCAGAVGTGEIASTPATARVAVLSVVAPSVAKLVKDPSIRFTMNQRGVDNVTAIQKSLAELAAKKADLAVLLYMGHVKEARECAKFCQKLATKEKGLPVVRAIVCMSDDPEPPFAPEVVGNTQIIWIGHKGKYVGVLGGYRSKQQPGQWDWKYQAVKIGPELDTPKGGEETHPVMKLMQDYANKVKAAHLVAQFIQVDHPSQQAFPNLKEKPKYVGSKRCMDCHPSAYQKWVNTPAGQPGHVNAFKTLEDKKLHPSERQFDPECVACHVVGFGKTGGYAGPFDARLKGVGCESCHGPCSEHVKNPFDDKWYPHINPLRVSDEERKLADKQSKGKLSQQESANYKQLTARRMNSTDRFCQSCHDIENDVHWNFEKRWPQIIHTTPANERKKNRERAAAENQQAAPASVILTPGTKKN